MDQLGVEASEVTIFEDSKSGITAAKNSNAKRIIGLMTSLDEQTLIDLGATFAIPDYRQVIPPLFLLVKFKRRLTNDRGCPLFSEKISLEKISQ